VCALAAADDESVEAISRAWETDALFEKFRTALTFA
jgi:hypothetical protein